MPSFDLPTVLNLPELKSLLKQVDDVLAGAVNKDNTYLYEPYKRLISSPGKRLRPSIVIAIPLMLGKEVSDDVITAAAAVEMVHIASLIHDDIIDNAATRRGVPTISGSEGLTQAIVIGDYLLAKAAEISASISGEIGQILGSATVRLCDGQGIETGDNFNFKRSLDSYYRAIAGKTAALLNCASTMGATLSGLSNKEVKSFTDFGEYFGLAFQLIDDLLDFVSNSELSSKPAGNDIIEGVYTLPVIHALSSPEGIKIKALIEADPKANASSITDMLFDSGAIKTTIQEINKYNSLASESVKAININGAKLSKLAELPASYFEWAISKQVDPKYGQRIAKY